MDFVGKNSPIGTQTCDAVSVEFGEEPVLTCANVWEISPEKIIQTGRIS